MKMNESQPSRRKKSTGLGGIKFDSFSLSNSLGPRHLENQDSYLTDEANLLFAVADGVGGYFGARQASVLAVATVAEQSRRITDEATAVSCLEEIHRRIQREARSLRYPNMGTTIALAKVMSKPGSEDRITEGEEGKLLTANVGDSPIFLFHNVETGDYSKLYTDDSFRGEDPLLISGIIQYLGLETEIDFHTMVTRYGRGDILLLCSDGITDNLLRRERPDEPSLSSIVRRHRSAEIVVRSAIERGYKPDDMTAVLVFL